ncbi:MAG TPA: hypothetical protein DDX93_00620, partial [Smithella sp.]|nr:hypothetical protein [Smithella sp.]
FFKQKTAYEIKECDWSSDVCSSDLRCLAEEYLENIHGFAEEGAPRINERGDGDAHALAYQGS